MIIHSTHSEHLRIRTPRHSRDSVSRVTSWDLTIQIQLTSRWIHLHYIRDMHVVFEIVILQRLYFAMEYNKKLRYVIKKANEIIAHLPEVHDSGERSWGQILSTGRELNFPHFRLVILWRLYDKNIYNRNDMINFSRTSLIQVSTKYFSALFGHLWSSITMDGAALFVYSSSQWICVSHRAIWCSKAAKE